MARQQGNSGGHGGAKKTAPSTNKVRKGKSRGPFYALLGVVAIAGAVAIWSSMSSKPKPIQLAPGTPLPESNGYLYGDANAPITIMEFADFECPGCMAFATMQEPDVRKRIVDAGLANFRFFDYPLDMHPNAMGAHLAAACAADQNKFWEMHDLLFRGQYDWNTQATSKPKKIFEGYVKELGLNEGQWNECYDSQRHVAKIEAHKAAGNARRVNSTPTFVIGDQVYASVLAADDLKKIVDSLHAARKSDTAARQ